MKKYLAPFLLLTLLAEAAGASGNFFCRMRGQWLSTCCCPDSNERSPGPMVAATGCCDVLDRAAPVSSERLPSRLIAGATTHSPLAMDVKLPAVPVDLQPNDLARHWVSASGPPRRIPVFLSLQQLLI
jgi:hypothetical protein